MKHFHIKLQMLFSLNFISTNFQKSCINTLLSLADELKSIRWFTLLASRDVRKMNFCRFDNLKSSLDRDDKSSVCSSSMLFCASFQNCESSNKFSECMYIGSGIIFSFLIC